MFRNRKNAIRKSQCYDPSAQEVKASTQRSESQASSENCLNSPDVPSVMKKFVSNSEVDSCKFINKKLRIISNLRSRNRIAEQQRAVSDLKIQFGGIRRIAELSGCRNNYISWLCSEPHFRIHKATQKAKERRSEFQTFLEMESISFVSPCRKYADKRFLMATIDETYRQYELHEEYHTTGKIAKSTFKSYRPKEVKLQQKIPLNQCLCEICANLCNLLEKLLKIGLTGIPSDKYEVVKKTFCDNEYQQFGTKFSFADIKCIQRECAVCGVEKLRKIIEEQNRELLEKNPTVEWQQWVVSDEASVPKLASKKAQLRQAVNELMVHIEKISDHLFRARWNRNLLTYIRENIPHGFVIQVQDFAMNFRNFYQNEIQLAYWGGTQTTIHATVNFMICPVDGCNKIYKVTLVHISADLQHDSFLARACQRMTMEYLCSIGIQLETVIQFTDNCKAQYKSKRPFAELARQSVPIIRCYFGEKHGKSHADALFGRLKKWMMDNIKSGRFIIRDAKDFYECCKTEYETKELHPCKSQHKRVVFQYVNPSDINRHHDCDVSTVKGTSKFFSVRNTENPLEILSREIPCLCNPCITNHGTCLNSRFTDKWKLQKLEPIKGENIRKHMKRKKLQMQNIHYNQMDEELQEVPSAQIMPDYVKTMNIETELARTTPEMQTASNESEIDGSVDPIECEDQAVGSKQQQENCEDVNDVAELLAATETVCVEVAMSADNTLVRKKLEPKIKWESMSRATYWKNLLYAFASSFDFTELSQKVDCVLKYGLPPMQPREVVKFDKRRYRKDLVAEMNLPEGFSDLIPVDTIGDGNCLCRALSKAYFGHEKYHLEIRARLVIEAIVNRKLYTDDNYISRGATNQYKKQTLPAIFTMYSRYYEPGQKLTDITVDTFYCVEAHSIAEIGSYLGIWQLAQAANVFKVPIRSVYPNGGSVFKDFNRFFFPSDSTYDTSAALQIMWTPVIHGTSPNHFVPLLSCVSE